MPKPNKKPKPRPTPVTCLCGTQRPYAECCGALHDGTRVAASPVELMRSRYTAFCLGKADYLWRTLHTQHESRAGDEATYAKGVQQTARTTRYRRLRVLDAREPDAAGVAQVLYHAEASSGKLDRSIVELSTFVQEAGEWRYLTGVARAARSLAHGVEDLSIDHWDCGHHH